MFLNLSLISHIKQEIEDPEFQQAFLTSFLNKKKDYEEKIFHIFSKFLFCTLSDRCVISGIVNEYLSKLYTLAVCYVKPCQT